MPNLPHQERITALMLSLNVRFSVVYFGNISKDQFKKLSVTIYAHSVTLIRSAANSVTKKIYTDCINAIFKLIVVYNGHAITKNCKQGVYNSLTKLKIFFQVKIIVDVNISTAL